ncbi:MAG: thioredoxin domain-containing protein [Betaproteobacteria bacterium]|nr:thioredoxin domain-containing protein [Betaproteobacteria bacterium]
MPNRLAQETSLYLQQHAQNPVDWYPWGEQALRLAREHDKPILLSVGYSACHWCHVMAHESFEDEAVAAQMNRLFVNIKVDREERPDLDQIYQSAHHMLTRRNGGWPLTMFLMPDGTPFFGGTYFPKTSRYNMPGFLDLLPRIEQAYREQRGEIAKQNASLLAALASMVPQPGAAVLERAPIAQALQELERIFDRTHGGIGRAPKFPHPYEFAFCLRRHALEGGAAALEIVNTTLTRMAEGGIYDHLGGGFARYSVDETWTIPHFEKMLYDNGPLLALYADAWRVTQAPRYQSVCEETAAWVMREMQSSEGGYYSSLDADSEHVEGKFYVWTPQEVQALITPEEYAVLAPHYGLDGAPNFEHEHWHLRVSKPFEGDPALLASARAKLLATRVKRIWPGRDEKILVSWNALMVTGMARAARVFDQPAWLASARRAVDFIRGTMWRNQRLLATYKDGKAHLNAYLDDYAFLLDALIELMQCEFRASDLDFARALAECLLDQFEDRQHGGFYFVSHDHEKLIQRTKPGFDNATPSGNGIAAFALQRLGHLIGEPRYLQAAERALKLFYDSLAAQPSAHASLLTALEEALTPPRIVVLRGSGEALKYWQRELVARYRPDTMVIALANDCADLPPALAKPAPAAAVNAWLCQGVVCLPPLADLGTIARHLDTVR